MAELEQLRLANAEEAAKAEELRKQREAEEAAKQLQELKRKEESAPRLSTTSEIFPGILADEEQQSFLFP